jgi:hypothetical protein
MKVNTFQRWRWKAMVKVSGFGVTVNTFANFVSTKALDVYWRMNGETSEVVVEKKLNLLARVTKHSLAIPEVVLGDGAVVDSENGVVEVIGRTWAIKVTFKDEKLVKIEVTDMESLADATVEFTPAEEEEEV